MVTDARTPERVILIGPSGSGKSELAGRLATALGYRAVDTDSVIEERIKMPVFEFFARFGEPAFRAIESDVLREMCGRSGVVVATGGGAVIRPENWTTFRPGSVVIALIADPETLVRRIDEQSVDGHGSAVRPLLAGDPAARIRQQLADRGALYAQADHTIQTDELDPAAVATVALSVVCGSSTVPRFSLQGQTERSDIYIQTGIHRHAGILARKRWPGARTVWIATDNTIEPYWAHQVGQLFEESGFAATTLVVPAGETSKSFEQVERLCLEMTSARVSRQDIVVALGGGVVGDLAGFVASICLRGLPLMQLPTSLLAMVDSSVGGKTGVNTRSGKNLVGTFNQPALVLVDPEFLSTLPADEYRSGMAEVIKHSIIQPSTPFGGNRLKGALDEMSSLLPVDDDVIEAMLVENVGIKHSVVQADERESGLRMILNFGHTAGHAIEADGYRYRHGEAVALGMMVAGRLALEEEMVDRSWLVTLESTLTRAGLPVRFEGRASDVIERLSHDKKNVDGALNWILPEAEDGVRIVRGIDTRRVELALRDIGAS